MITAVVCCVCLVAAVNAAQSQYRSHSNVDGVLRQHCKLLERIIHNKMLRYLSANGLISQHQHGFLAKHSTCTQLLETVNDWSIALILLILYGYAIDTLHGLSFMTANVRV